MNTLIGLVKSKTAIFNAAVALLEITGQLQGIVPPGTALIVVNVLNIVLRIVTTQALADK